MAFALFNKILLAYGNAKNEFIIQTLCAMTSYPTGDIENIELNFIYLITAFVFVNKLSVLCSIVVFPNRKGSCKNNLEFCFDNMFILPGIFFSMALLQINYLF